MTAEAARRLPCNIVESGPAGGVVRWSRVRSKGWAKEHYHLRYGRHDSKGVSYRGWGIYTLARVSGGWGNSHGFAAHDGRRISAKGTGNRSCRSRCRRRFDHLDRCRGLHADWSPKCGADPGPVCYDIGGTEPTITDANVALGYLNQEYLVGGELKIDASRSREVLKDKIAKPLGLTLERAAYGAHQIAISNMIRAIRAVSSERGETETICDGSFWRKRPPIRGWHGAGTAHVPDHRSSFAGSL